MQKLDNKKVCKNIKHLRRHYNFSQDYMAQRLGVNQTSYGRLELGHRELKLNTLLRIAEILNVTIFDLLDINAIYRRKNKTATQSHETNQLHHKENRYNHLIDTISHLENRLKDKEEIIKNKNHIIELLTKNKKDE